MSTTPRVEFVKEGEGSHGKDLNEIIEELGFGKFQLRLLFICGLGWAADSAELSFW